MELKSVVNFPINHSHNLLQLWHAVVVQLKYEALLVVTIKPLNMVYQNLDDHTYWIWN